MGNILPTEEGQAYAVGHWDLIPDEVLVLILSYLKANEVARVATVSKQFCVCSFNNSLWKEKFYEDYNASKKKILSARDTQFETSFRDLLDRDHPEHYVLTDWRRGYITKVKYDMSQERLQCFSNCLSLSYQGVPFLNAHTIPGYAFEPHLFEQVEPLKIERIFSKREDRTQKKVAPLTANDKGLAIYESLLEEDPEKQELIWLVVDGAKHPSIVPKIQESDALSMSLLGKWFNQTNSNNFPFLVKFTSDPELSKWLFTYGYDKSAVLVMFIDKNLPEKLTHEWYLSGYDATTALMVYLKRHLGQFFTLDKTGFCWIYDPTVIYTLALTFHSSLTNKLFYTIKSKGLFLESKFLVVDSYMLFGNGFYPGELPEDLYILKYNRSLPGCRNFAGTEDKINRAVAVHIEDRRIFLAAKGITNSTWVSKSQEEKHQYLLEANQIAKKYKVNNSLLQKFLSIANYSPGEFWKVPKIARELNAEPITDKRLTTILDGLKAEHETSVKK